MLAILNFLLFHTASLPSDRSRHRNGCNSTLSWSWSWSWSWHWCGCWCWCRVGLQPRLHISPMSSKVQADVWGCSRGVSRCKYRWRWYNVAGRRRGHKAPTLASIECCRQIHHLLSDRITGARYTARCVELGLGRGPRAGDGGENASDQFAVSCSLSFVVIT